MNDLAKRLRRTWMPAILVAMMPWSITWLAADDSSDSTAPTVPVVSTSRLVDVFRPNEDGYPAIRIPAIVTTRRGVLLAFAEGRQGGDHSENDLILKRSVDSGKTWQPVQVIDSAGKLSLNNPQPVVLDSGRVLVMYQRNRLGEHKASPGYGKDSYFTFLQHSDDEGKTWSDPIDVSKQVKRAEHVTSVASGPGIGIVLQRGEHAGRIIMPMNQGPYGDWRVYAVYSDDQGATWEMGNIAPRNPKTDVPDGFANEIQMVELSDGRVMLNARNQGKGTSKHRKVSTSSDGGQTWSALADDPTLIEPVCQASLLRYSFPNPSSPGEILFLNPASKDRREHGLLRVSQDDGKTWPKSLVIYPKSFAYSCMTRMQDDRIGILFERDDYQRISFVAVSIDELAKSPE